MTTKMRIKIIYEDKEILVCYKPAGLAVQTARIGQADMVSELKNYLAASGEKNPYLGLVHRLDQPVEGLLVFGRTKGAAASLSGQLEKGLLHKRYYAVVCGKPEQKSGEFVDYLQKTPDNKARIVTEQVDALQPQAEVSDARKAVLQYNIVQSLEVQSVHRRGVEWISLAKIHIDTGRFHQIRAQMSHGGLPLLGDQKYGDEASVGLSGHLGIKDVALCACQLDFNHPVTGNAMHFSQPPQGKAFSFFGIF